jgi:ankyrin repeat protein
MATLPIFLAAERGDVIPALLDHLQAAGIPIDAPAETRAKSLIDAAIERQDAELVRELVRRGVAVDRCRSYQSTLLHAAMEHDSDEIVDILIDAGADLQAHDHWFHTVAHGACKHPHRLRGLADRGVAFDRPVDPPLLSAARHGYAEAVDFLLERGVRVDVFDAQGWTPLTLAIEKEHAEIAMRLLDAGASPTLASRSTGDPPLHAAAKANHVELVRALIARGASVLDKNRDGDDVLTLIGRRKQLRQAFAELLAEHGIDTSVPKVEPLDPVLAKCTPVWAAVYGADEAAVAKAIEAGEHRVDDRDPWGTTALMAAVMRGKAGLVEKLIELGANVDLEDGAGARAWDYAGFERDEQIDELLKNRTKDALPSMDRLDAMASRAMAAGELGQAIERGELRKVVALLADKKVHPFLGRGKPLLLEALDADDEDLMGLLLDLGLSAEVPDAYGTTPLSTALGSDNFELAQRLVANGARADAPGLLASVINGGSEQAVGWLLERGADLSGPNSYGDRPIHIAVEANNVELAKRLVAADRGQLEARNGSVKFTPLHVAINQWDSCEDCARFLVEAGANVDAFDEIGRTPLHIAVNYSYEEAARFLVEHGARWDIVDPEHPDTGSPREAATADGKHATWPEKAAAKRIADGDPGRETNHHL